jgi:hypothetical protein
MASDSGQRPRDDAEAVRAAARLSLAARGVRLCRFDVREDDGGWTKPWAWQVGVADLSARSAHWHHYLADDSPWMKLGEAAVQRWPWLDDEHTLADRDERGGYETIEIERQTYGGGNGWWSAHSDLPVYGPARGLWPLEAILGTTRATAIGFADMGGESCARYLCEVRPGDAIGSGQVKLIDPPVPDDGWRALGADICIDAGGYVRRIACSPVVGRFYKPGLLPRLLTHLARRSDSDQSRSGEGRRWTVIDLWDYGCSVEVTAPTDLRDPAETSLLDIARDLWQMRRKYKERTR